MSEGKGKLGSAIDTVMIVIDRNPFFWGAALISIFYYLGWHQVTLEFLTWLYEHALLKIYNFISVHVLDIYYQIKDSVERA